VQDINLDLDKENELVFKLSIVGTKPASTKSRFMLESDSFSLVFPASKHESGEVSILIPPLENVLAEGKYAGSLEVIVDDKVFTPMKIETDFKKSVNVMAEVVTARSQPTTLKVSPVITVNKRETSIEPDSASSAKKDLQLEENIVETSTVAAPVKDNPEKTVSSPPVEPDERRDAIEKRIRKLAESKKIKISSSKIQEIANFLKDKDIKK
jgi:hypothetical protein